MYGWVWWGLFGLLLSVLTVSGTTAVGGYEKRVRIIGGKSGDSREYGEYVMITVGPLGALSCGGTLIAERVVLTAAHCICKVGSEELLDSSGANVFQGNLRLNTTSGMPISSDSSSAVRKWIRHPKYDHANITNDVALVFLEDDLPGPFATLPEIGSQDPQIGDTIKVVGFGRNNNYIVPSKDPGRFVASPSPVLYEVGLVVGDPNQNPCRNAKDFELETEICYVGEKFNLNEDAVAVNGNTNPGFTGTCAGDSGGPSFDENGVQIGIISYGSKRCFISFNYPVSIDTNIRKYLCWICMSIAEETGTAVLQACDCNPRHDTINGKGETISKNSLQSGQQEIEQLVSVALNPSVFMSFILMVVVMQ